MATNEFARASFAQPKSARRRSRPGEFLKGKPTGTLARPPAPEFYSMDSLEALQEPEEEAVLSEAAKPEPVAVKSRTLRKRGFWAQVGRIFGKLLRALGLRKGGVGE